MFVIDTNVLVYAADADSEFHARCKDLIETCASRSSAWYITWGIVYEFLSVSTHPRVFRKAWSLAPGTC